MLVYKNKPDVLELVVDELFLSALEIKKVEYSFGPSREDFCYFEGVLVGQITGNASISSKYYEGLGVKHDGRIVVKLTPMVHKNEYLLCPMYETFQVSLQSLLHTTKGWVLICEADCDQAKVVENPELESVLTQLRGFCEGVHYDCPTFIYRK